MTLFMTSDKVMFLGVYYSCFVSVALFPRSQFYYHGLPLQYRQALFPLSLSLSFYIRVVALKIPVISKTRKIKQSKVN